MIRRELDRRLEDAAASDGVLTFAGESLGDEGATFLASHPTLAAIRLLSLAYNGVGDAGAVALARSPYMTGIKRLDLGQSDLTDAGVFALAQSPFLVSVFELHLQGNQDGTEGRRSLGLRSALWGLSSFRLRYCVSMPPGFHALRVARLAALGCADDDDLFGLEPHLLPEHRAWWEDKLGDVKTANLDRALALCPAHPRLQERKAALVRLQQCREDPLFLTTTEKRGSHRLQFLGKEEDMISTAQWNYEVWSTLDIPSTSGCSRMDCLGGKGRAIFFESKEQSAEGNAWEFGFDLPPALSPPRSPLDFLGRAS